MKAAGIKMRHLPTNGGGPALTAFLGNNAQVLVSSISASLRPDQGRQGCAPLALFGAKRSKALPDVPTMKELGYDVEYYLWVGLFAPKGTPADDHRQAARGLDKAAHTDTFKKAMSNLGQELDYHGPAGLRAILGRRRPRVTKPRSSRSASKAKTELDPLDARRAISSDNNMRSRRPRRRRIFRGRRPAVIALSGDLPFGQLSMPGAGFLPLLVAVSDHRAWRVAVSARQREPGLLPRSNGTTPRMPLQVLVITGVARCALHLSRLHHHHDRR